MSSRKYIKALMTIQLLPIWLKFYSAVFGFSCSKNWVGFDNVVKKQQGLPAKKCGNTTIEIESIASLKICFFFYRFLENFFISVAIASFFD